MGPKGRDGAHEGPLRDGAQKGLKGRGGGISRKSTLNPPLLTGLIYGHVPSKTGQTVLRVQHRIVAANGYIICIYNISSLENNDSTKFVISFRAGGKHPARMITTFVLIIFWASYVIYLYNIHWLLHL